MSKFSNARKLLAMAQRYAQQNPDKVRGMTDKAARFADQRTHGRYRRQIDNAVRKVDEASGSGSRRDTHRDIPGDYRSEHPREYPQDYPRDRYRDDPGRHG